MNTEFSPPYRAHKSAGHFYVVNRNGGFEMACNGRHEAEECAREMNRQHYDHCCGRIHSLPLAADLFQGLAGEEIAL